MRKILVVGSSNIDFVVGVSEMPQKGETILCNSFNKVPGGKGANQACACGKLGGICTFLSAVGDDGLGDLVLDSLKAANVDVSRVDSVKGQPSGMALITVNTDGENSIVVIPGANACCDENYFNQNMDCINASDIVLAQLETPTTDVYTLLEKVKKAGKTTILNPAPAPDSIDDEVLNGLDYLTPNETELAKLTGMPTDTLEQIEEAAKKLLARGVRNVIVTIGPRGAMLCNRDGCTVHPTFDTQRVDTTAAGDTFSAGIAVGLTRNMDLTEAIRFANAAAAISITRQGAQTSIPDIWETEHLMNSKRD